MSSTILPVHPVTGIHAVGWRKARSGEDPDQRYPIWPILGAADDDPDEDGQDDTDDQDQDQDDGDGEDGQGRDAADDDQGGGSDTGAADDGADQLGDRGKQALDRMKEKLKAERTRRREAEGRLAQGQDTGSTDSEAIRRQAEQAATAKANKRIVRSEVRAAAAGKLADPRDALTFLDLDQFEVDEDGQIDEDEIADAIEDLVKNKPYLAAATAKRFQGTGDGGAARKAGRPRQLTEQDLKTMTPEQIDEAAEDGRLEDLLKGG
ncbi:hypothetical protein [Streptomyces apocyni]|uniref:hypothetical protein n=1 Tax=Streptomyces apocyni TaxID=2654677 RepID=UPI0012EAABE2|nr:hypothetical protein [Streptomyces apocyni]